MSTFDELLASLKDRKPDSQIEGNEKHTVLSFYHGTCPRAGSYPTVVTLTQRGVSSGQDDDTGSTAILAVYTSRGARYWTPDGMMYSMDREREVKGAYNYKCNEIESQANAEDHGAPVEEIEKTPQTGVANADTKVPQ